MSDISTAQFLKEAFRLQSEKHYKQAIEALYKALCIESDNVEILSQISHLYFLMNNFERALEYAEKILERKKQRRREQLAAWLMILPYLLIFIVFTVVPVVMGTGFSFMRYNPYDSTENAFFGFQNYINIFNFSLPISKTFWKSFSTMLLFDVICVPILMVLSLLIAYFVNKKPPLYKFFRAIIFLPSVISVSVTGVIFGNMFASNRSGLFNAWFGTEIDWLGGIPFDIKLEQPNRETIAALLEAERIAKDPSVKGYNDLDELFADLKK